jgi:ribosomal protein S16
MLKIRLTRVGKKNSPAYRVVVADSKKAVQRKFIEIIGHYNPASKPKEIVIDKERALYWIGNGAQASDTVNNLMVDLGILKEKVNKIYRKKTEKQLAAEKEAADKAAEAENAAKETPAESTEEAQAEAKEAEEAAEAKVEEEAPVEETTKA